MTAEVAILNREAVAIAADSAVTIGGPGSKIYNTANKLFALSTVEPVAVMIYGADAFGTIPWETIVKDIDANWLLLRILLLRSTRQGSLSISHHLCRVCQPKNNENKF